MSYGIGDRVKIITTHGEVVGRDCSPGGQEFYRVKLDDGKVKTFTPDEIIEVRQSKDD